MKAKFTNLLAIAFLVSIVSCSTDTSIIDESIDVDSIFELKIEKVTKMINRSEQRIAYNLLSEHEKLFLWKKKIYNIIKDSKQSISNNKDKQIQLLNELIDELDLEIFGEDENDKREYFKNIFVPDFIDRAKKTFSTEMIETSFYEISDKDYVGLLLNENEDDECDCNSTSFFTCQWGQDETCEVKEDACDGTPDGCGFLTMYSCDALCNLWPT